LIAFETLSPQVSVPVPVLYIAKILSYEMKRISETLGGAAVFIW
jgi:hypothetical protein